MKNNRDLESLLITWNSATAPYVLRNDHEHHRQRQRARAALKLIRRRFVEGRDYVEFSNGSLWPKS